MSHLVTNNGLYLANRMETQVIPYLESYVDIVTNDLRPTFDDLEGSATKVAETTYERQGTESFDIGGEGDLSSAAEDAESAGINFYLTMTSLRQASLNLYAVGLYHLLEQQVASLSRDGLFRGLPMPKDGRLGNIRMWFAEQLGFELEGLAEWLKINELRLVANTTKHAEGGSARQLRDRRSDLFQNPITADLLAAHSWLQQASPVDAPLAGEGLFVTDADFDAYGEAVLLFARSMAQQFRDLQRDPYE